MDKPKRRTLKFLASWAGIPIVAGFPQWAFDQDNKIPVRVAVYGVDGALLSAAAKVTFTSLTTPAVQYVADKGKHLYYANLMQNEYRLEVSNGVFLMRGEVKIENAWDIFHVFLGDVGWPSYRIGKNVIPYEPARLDYLTVVLEMSERWPQVLADDLYAELKSKGLVEGTLPGTLTSGSRPYLAINDKVFGIRLKRSDRPQARDGIEEFLKTQRPDLVIAHRIRIGTPVVTLKGAFRMIDGRHFVRFPWAATDQEARKVIADAGAIVIRAHFLQAPNLYLIEFPGDDFLSNENTLRSWVANKKILSHEADVIAEMTWHAFPDDLPDDSLFEPATSGVHPGQRIHLADRQKIAGSQGDGAWAWLKNKGRSFLGDPLICMATLDTGIDPNHPDINVNTLRACYDFSVLSPNYRCSDRKYQPTDSHGMGVFGLVGASTDNSVCSAGIAPQSAQVVVTIPQDLWHAQYYADILLWAAGFPSPMGWPAVTPPKPGAAIINCSHGASYLPLSDLMNSTFDYLVEFGHDKKGTLVVYSAGNNGLPVSTVSTWAAHPKTMAVSCSDLQGANEVIWSNSNYGPEIDICALGQNIVSLAPSYDRVFTLCSNKTKGRYQIFGMTSSAAPMVSATAALILSAQNDLPWDQLRDILCNGADKIDCTNSSPERGWRNNRYDTVATGITDCDGVSPPGTQWFSWGYGFGRLNALNAVKIVAP